MLSRRASCRFLKTLAPITMILTLERLSPGQCHVTTQPVRRGVEPSLVIVTRSLAWGALSHESASPPFVVSQRLCRSHIFTHVHYVVLHSCSQCLQTCKIYCIYSSYQSRPCTTAPALRYLASAITLDETLLQVVS